MGWFIPFLAAAGAQAGINAATAGVNTRRQYKYAMRLADAEFQRNYQMWQEMNAYNHPKAQMERFAEAGLNPALVYGSGANTVAADSPQYSLDKNVVSDIEPVDIRSGLMAYFDIQSRQRQIEYIDEQIKAQQIANLNSMRDGVIKDLQIEREKATLPYAKMSARAAYRIQEAQATISEKDALIAYQLGDKSNVSRIVDAQLRKIEAEARYLENNLNIQALEAKLKEQGIQLNELEIALRKYGVSSGDPLYFRFLAQLLRALGINVYDLK